MPDILIRCRVWNVGVPTGLTTDVISLDSMHMMPELRVPMRCPACNRTHYWSAGDAWVEETKDRRRVKSFGRKR